MFLRFIQSYANSRETYFVGGDYILDDDEAKQVIRAGLAIDVTDEVQRETEKHCIPEAEAEYQRIAEAISEARGINYRDRIKQEQEERAALDQGMTAVARHFDNPAPKAKRGKR